MLHIQKIEQSPISLAFVTVPAGASPGKSRRACSQEALAAGGDEAKGAFDAMMGMKKIDVAAIKAARRG